MIEVGKKLFLAKVIFFKLNFFRISHQQSPQYDDQLSNLSKTPENSILSSPQSATNSSFSESQLSSFKEDASLLVLSDKFIQDSGLDLRNLSNRDDLNVKSESDANKLSTLSSDIITDAILTNDVGTSADIASELATTPKSKKDGVAFATDVLEAEKAKDEAEKAKVATIVDDDDDYDAEIEEKPIDKSPG